MQVVCDLQECWSLIGGSRRRGSSGCCGQNVITSGNWRPHPPNSPRFCWRSGNRLQGRYCWRHCYCTKCLLLCRTQTEYENTSNILQVIDVVSPRNGESLTSSFFRVKEGLSSSLCNIGLSVRIQYSSSHGKWQYISFPDSGTTMVGECEKRDGESGFGRC